MLVLEKLKPPIAVRLVNLVGSKFLFLLGLAGLSLLMTGCTNPTDMAQKLPLGWMDSPAQSAVLRGVAVLAGWAVCEDGIASVALYVDRSFVSKTEKLNGSRPDVISLFPSFAGAGDMQWKINLDTSSLAPGPHDILTRAISKKGAVRDLGSVKVTIER
jgi:hypothetical protein